MTADRRSLDRRRHIDRRLLTHGLHDLVRAPSWGEQRTQHLTRIMFLILGFVYFNVGQEPRTVLVTPLTVNVVLLIYGMLICLTFWHAYHNVYSPVRWRAAMWIDLLGTSFATAVDPAIVSPVMLLYLTVMFGNGLRYGTLFLAETVIGSFFFGAILLLLRFNDFMGALTMSSVYMLMFGAILVLYGYSLTRNLEKARRHLESERSMDMLTGLLNRRALFERADGIFRATKLSDHPIVTLFIDLDRFKAINDNLGHHVGDRVLSEVARLFSGTVRGTDLLGRFGGDEFVFVLPSTDMERGMAVAERLQTLVAEWAKKNDVDLSLSIGIGQAPLHGTDLATLLERVDKAMYQSKLVFGRGGILRVEQTVPA
jgi:diguanylate cyclase (GGDEF)-like protein